MMVDSNYYKLQVRTEDVVVGDDHSFSCRREPQLLQNKSSSSKLTSTSRARERSPQKNGKIVPGIHPISVNCGHSYPDPIPVAMQSVRILDLATVDINWKMLTVSRPTNKLDEEYFTKYIQFYV